MRLIIAGSRDLDFTTGFINYLYNDVFDFNKKWIVDTIANANPFEL